jgi:epoxyqueuosine reductase
MQEDNIFYKYKAVSVDHLKELQDDIDKLYREDKLSHNEVYRSYIENKRFQVPENLPNAKSIIILAIFTKLALINFNFEGKKRQIMIPPQYYDDGLELEDIKTLVKNKIIKQQGYKIEMTNSMHLKLLAVRSGLGKYGKNNLCYVDEMGSFISLYGFFTDFEFKQDNWTDIKMMDQCNTCTICMKNCPNGCIREDNFVIDAGRCLPLFNEIQGTFPDWLDDSAHNALIGCMRCQLPCPADHQVINQPVFLEDLTEQETNMILNGRIETNLLNSLCKKLKMFAPENSDSRFPVIQRNLKALINS